MCVLPVAASIVNLSSFTTTSPRIAKSPFNDASPITTVVSVAVPMIIRLESVIAAP